MAEARLDHAQLKGANIKKTNLWQANLEHLAMPDLSTGPACV